MDNRFIRRTVICVEKLVYYRNPDTSKQWLGPCLRAKVIVKKIDLAPKQCVSGGILKVVIHWEFVTNGRAVDVDLLSQQLERVHEILRWRYLVLVNRIRNLLQQDNARPHTARRTMAEIQELGEIELLPHPTYSPDLVPSDYNLFQSMVYFLYGRNSRNIKAVEVGLTELFASKTRD